MSMSLTQAKLEVARVAGGAGDPNKLALAASAIAATAKRWTNKNNWEWTRRDNTLTVAIAGMTTSGSPIVTALDPGAAGLNPGQAVTGTGIPASTTILTVDSLTQVTLNKNATATSVSPVTLTFAGYLAVIAGTSTYFLPPDFKDFYSARLLSTKRTLTIIRDRQVDRQEPEQAISGPIVGITFAPPGSDSGFTAADQRPRCRLLPYLPDTTELLLLKYYRTIDGTSDPIDIPTDFEYAFLDDAKTWFLAHLNSNDPRLTVLDALSTRNLKDAISSDRDSSDEDVRIKSQMEVFQTMYTERGHALRGF